MILRKLLLYSFLLSWSLNVQPVFKDFYMLDQQALKENEHERPYKFSKKSYSASFLGNARDGILLSCKDGDQPETIIKAFLDNQKKQANRKKVICRAAQYAFAGSCLMGMGFACYYTYPSCDLIEVRSYIHSCARSASVAWSCAGLIGCSLLATAYRAQDLEEKNEFFMSKYEELQKAKKLYDKALPRVDALEVKLKNALDSNRSLQKKLARQADMAKVTNVKYAQLNQSYEEINLQYAALKNEIKTMNSTTGELQDSWNSVLKHAQNSFTKLSPEASVELLVKHMPKKEQISHSLSSEHFYKLFLDALHLGALEKADQATRAWTYKSLEDLGYHRSNINSAPALGMLLLLKNMALRENKKELGELKVKYSAAIEKHEQLLFSKVQQIEVLYKRLALQEEVALKQAKEINNLTSKIQSLTTEQREDLEMRLQEAQQKIVQLNVGRISFGVKVDDLKKEIEIVRKERDAYLEKLNVLQFQGMMKKSQALQKAKNIENDNSDSGNLD